MFRHQTIITVKYDSYPILSRPPTSMFLNFSQYEEGIPFF